MAIEYRQPRIANVGFASMKVSIVTVCLNAVDTIGDCVASVAAQEAASIEHIIIDGCSTDGTLRVLEQHRTRVTKLISEKDEGLYHAMNKGLGLATGDVVGFLNADDTLATTQTIARIVGAMEQNDAELVFGDVEIYDSRGVIKRIYRGDRFDTAHIASASLPPHPSVYARTSLLLRAGGFDPRFKIASDFDLLIRIVRHFSPRIIYLPATIVKMRGGGLSDRGLSSYLTISRELIEACQNNGLRPNYLAIHGRIFRKGSEVADGLWRRFNMRRSWLRQS